MICRVFNARRLASALAGALVVLAATACASAQTDPYDRDPLSPPRPLTDGQIRSKYGEIMERLGISEIPPVEGTLVPGLLFDIDDVPGLKGWFVGGPAVVPTEDGIPLAPNAATTVGGSLTVQIRRAYRYADVGSDEVVTPALMVTIEVAQRTARDAFVSFLAHCAAANEPATRPSFFPTPPIGTVRAAWEGVVVDDAGTRSLARLGYAFVRHNIKVVVEYLTPHAVTGSQPSQATAAEAVLRYLDRKIASADRFESISASGLAPVVDRFGLTDFDPGAVLPIGAMRLGLTLTASDPHEVPLEYHLNVAGLADRTGVWIGFNQGEWTLDVGDDRPLERVLRARVVNLRGCMTEVTRRYAVAPE